MRGPHVSECACARGSSTAAHKRTCVAARSRLCEYLCGSCSAAAGQLLASNSTLPDSSAWRAARGESLPWA
eukprot:scaffold7488_cov444-Prasinococcus_capsulatus_cf.AAC.2